MLHRSAPDGGNIDRLNPPPKAVTES